MSREEQIRQAVEKEIIGCSGEYTDGYESGFFNGAKWSDANPKHYSFKEAMDACMGSYEEGDRQLLYVANQTAERTKKEVISKACEWLLHQEEMIGISFENDFIERFKKAMES